jgi:hypothetical protein
MFTKNKKIGKILAIALTALTLAAIFPPPPATAADATVSATLTGVGSISFTSAMDDRGYPIASYVKFAAQSDGLYQVSTDGARLALYFLLDKNASETNITGNGQDTGSKYEDGTNKLTGRDFSVCTVFLFKGEYYFELYKAGKHNEPVNITVEAKKVTPHFGAEEREPNSSKGDALTFAVGAKAVGYINGIYDDGSRDNYDWYVFHAEKGVEINLRLEMWGHNPIGLYNSVDFEMALYGSDGDKRIAYDYDRGWNGVDNVGYSNIRATLPESGNYYICVWGRSKQCSYTLTEGAGTAPILDVPGANAYRPASLTPIKSGAKIILPTSTGGIGFRIYRNDTVYEELVTGGVYVDVNVTPGEKYVYTICEVFSNGTTGELSQALEMTAPEDLLGSEIQGKKGYILMAIDSPFMSVNGEEREIDPGRGTAPTLISDRTMVPIRAIVEAMGGTVGWNEAERKIDLAYGGHSVTMRLDSKDITADGAPKSMDVAPTVKNGRTLLPIRFAAENLSCEIEWIGSTREIVIVFS